MPKLPLTSASGMKHEAFRVAVIGGGPAGLMAATELGPSCAPQNVAIDLYESMPSVGRKLLVAGVGGLNLTHSEALETFAARYGAEAERFERFLRIFSPTHLREFAARLGVETMIGSSGRVFPVSLKAAPLLRSWVREMKRLGIRIHTRHRLVDLAPGPRLTIQHGDAPPFVETPDAVVLALGGATWRRLGSDGLWTRLLANHGVDLRPFQPSNCGFEVAWSPHFKDRFEGTPLKNIALEFAGKRVPGELVITRYGLEGGPLYALSKELRSAIETSGSARITIDLKPAWSEGQIRERLELPRGGRSVSDHLRKTLRQGNVAFPLLRETSLAADLNDSRRAASLVKALPLVLRGVRSLDEAISSAGGVSFLAVDEHLMLTALPGFFVAGEMLDYEPPTGGYLLQAAFTTGVVASRGVADWLRRQRSADPPQN